jgi:hypothetical protein
VHRYKGKGTFSENCKVKQEIYNELTRQPIGTNTGRWIQLNDRNKFVIEILFKSREIFDPNSFLSGNLLPFKVAIAIIPDKRHFKLQI